VEITRTYRKLRKISAALGMGRLPLTVQLDGIFLSLVIPNPVKLNGLRFYWGRKGHLYLAEIASTTKTYEPDVQKVLKEILKPGMNFIDVGACIGYHTVVASKLVADGKVLAIEPIPYTYKYLTKNLLGNKCNNVIPSMIGISNEEGFANLYLGKRNIDSSSLCKGNKHCSNKSITIQLTTLDRLTEKYNLQRVDLIKMDIEGSEIKAFEGMKRLSEGNPNLKLMVEYDDFVQNLGGHTKEKFYECLTELGFTKIINLTSDPKDIPNLFCTK
jgi:FkbM family methyltransferase